VGLGKDNIALIGFMGVGKTLLGGLLSRTFNMAFLDMDLEIEKQMNMPVSQIFKEFGAGCFRAVEHDLCKKIPQMKGFVIATGGGVLTDERNLPLLRESCLIIYLQASAETLYGRLESDETRPLLQDLPQGADKLAAIKELLAEREPLYRAAADLVVAVGEFI
jgi:shikimate kinase